MITEPTQIWTVRDVAEYLHIHPSTVYRLVKNSKLPAFKVGSDWRFDRARIETWTRDQSIHVV